MTYPGPKVPLELRLAPRGPDRLDASARAAGKFVRVGGVDNEPVPRLRESAFEHRNGGREFRHPDNSLTRSVPWERAKRSCRFPVQDDDAAVLGVSDQMAIEIVNRVREVVLSPVATASERPSGPSPSPWRLAARRATRPPQPSPGGAAEARKWEILNLKDYNYSCHCDMLKGIGEDDVVGCELYRRGRGRRDDKEPGQEHERQRAGLSAGGTTGK